jgi:hypothetical protein
LMMTPTRLYITGDGVPQSYQPALNAFQPVDAPEAALPGSAGYCTTVMQDTVTEVRQGGAASAFILPHRLFFVPESGTSTNDVVLVNRPSIVCDAALGLVLASNLLECVRCPEQHTVEQFECVPICVDCDGPKTVSIAIAVSSLVLVFLLGAAIGLCARWATSKRKPANLEYAPKSSPCALALIAVPNMSAMWRAKPREMGIAMGKYQDLIATMIERHQCYLVRHIGEAYFVVGENADQVMRLLVEVIKACRRESWPSRLCAIEPGAALHWGRPSIVLNDVGLDYIGDDVELLTAVASKAHAGEILVTESSLQATDLDIIADCEPDQIEQFFDERQDMLSRFQRVGVTKQAEDDVAVLEGSFASPADEPFLDWRVPFGVAENHPLVSEEIMTANECHAAMELYAETFRAILAPLKEKEKQEMIATLFDSTATRHRAASVGGADGGAARPGGAEEGLEMIQPTDFVTRILYDALPKIDIVELKLAAQQTVVRRRKRAAQGGGHSNHSPAGTPNSIGPAGFPVPPTP